MNREETIELIKNRLQLISLLKAQPEPSTAEIDDVMWDILGDILALDDEHKKMISELEAREANTLEEEVAKRREIYELAKNYSDSILGLFNLEIPEEKQMFDLFDEMRNDTKLRETDYNLLKSQSIELKNRQNEIQELLDSAISFEEMESELSETYAEFIKENKIESLDLETIKAEIRSTIELKEIIERNRELLKTAKGIDKKEFSSVNQISQAERKYEQAKENLFLLQMKEVMSTPVTNYTELLQRTKRVEQLVLEREGENFASELMNFGNQQQINQNVYRTLYFMNDVRKVEHQVNLAPNLERLKSEVNSIEKRLDSIYEKFNGNKSIKEVAENYSQLKETLKLAASKKEEQLKRGYKGTVEQDKQIVLYDQNEEKSKVGLKDKLKGRIMIIKAKAQGNLPILKVIEEKSKSILKTMKRPFSAIKKISEKPMNVVKGKIRLINYRAKAKSKLLKNISKNKDRIKKIMLVSTLGTAMLVGSTGLTSSKSDKVISVTPPAITQVMEENDLEVSDAIQITNEIEEVEQAIDEYNLLIGDHLHINEEVDLYRSSTGDNESKKVKENDYFINRIAIVDKNNNSKILDVSTTSGKSVEDLTKNLKKDSYEIMIHLGTGIDGNYVEATRSAGSPDDYGWVKVDSSVLENIKIIEKGLDKSEEKGINL